MVRAIRPRPRVAFKKKAMTSPARNLQAQHTRTADDQADEVFTEKLSSARIVPASMIPDLFTRPPPVTAGLKTPTTEVQDETCQICLPLLAGQDDSVELNGHGVPRLVREKHARFLHMNLGRLPGRFVAADASRPWFLCWCLSGLAFLGQDLSSYRDSLVETARSMQNDSGGFGGGGRQLSHLATTYATVLALAVVGGEDAFELVDRRAMWKWLGSLKQPDGGFQVCIGGEEDVRGAYCAAVIITLLNIPLDLTPESPARVGGHQSLFAGLPEYIRRCQTYEGGISDKPGTEAHGAYAFCALACLSILGHPKHIIPKFLNVPRLLSWLSSRQYAPEGGFSGRTNKLVDGCYSHWVGACFPLLEACLSGDPTSPAAVDLPRASESIQHREGVVRYILNCCQDQSKRGGLRDKPGKSSDAYHTCYVLEGLSCVQHQWEVEPALAELPLGGGADAVWNAFPYLKGVQVFDDRDRLRPAHPIYAIPQSSQETMRNYFLAKEGF